MTSSADSRRIGGEFELDASQFGIDRAQRAPLPSYGNPCELWLDTGRSALAVVTAHLSRVAKDGVVWLPAYCCESIVGPFLRQGLRTRYYAVGAKLDRIAADPARGDTLLFIHYFGARNREALARVAEFRAQGVGVIEDCVQAALTSGIGQLGDYAVTSLRKLLAQPDGALLSSRSKLDAHVGIPDEGFVSARVIGKLMRSSGAPAGDFLPLFEESERRLADDRPRAMSRFSQHLLERADLGSAAARRRSNFTALAAMIAELPREAGVMCLMERLDDGEVPLGLPVVVARGKRDALRRHLMAEGIFCPVHWDLSHVDGGFAEEHALAASILTLPVDQRYDHREMCEVRDSLLKFIGATA